MEKQEHTKPAGPSDVLRGIDNAIDLLKNVKKGITESNFNDFEILVSNNRDIKPIYSSFEAIGFEQSGSDDLSIVVKNRCNVGKLLI